MTDQALSGGQPKNLSEAERRALALRHRGEVADEPTEAVEPRRMAQMMSVRLDPAVVVALRSIANVRAVSVSDLLREGAERVIKASQGQRPSVHVTYSSATRPWSALSGSYDVDVQVAVYGSESSGSVSEAAS
jgi:ABC-type polar amino acid transport system ATPase subunit